MISLLPCFRLSIFLTSSDFWFISKIFRFFSFDGILCEVKEELGQDRNIFWIFRPFRWILSSWEFICSKLTPNGKHLTRNWGSINYFSWIRIKIDLNCGLTNGLMKCMRFPSSKNFLNFHDVKNENFQRLGWVDVRLISNWRVTFSPCKQLNLLFISKI